MALGVCTEGAGLVYPWDLQLGSVEAGVSVGLFLGCLDEAIKTLVCPCLLQANCAQGEGSGKFLAWSQCMQTGHGVLALLLLLATPDELLGHPVSLPKAIQH